MVGFKTFTLQFLVKKTLYVETLSILPKGSGIFSGQVQLLSQSNGTYSTVCSLGYIRYCMLPREYTTPYTSQGIYGTVCSLNDEVHWLTHTKFKHKVYTIWMKQMKNGDNLENNVAKIKQNKNHKKRRDCKKL